MDKVMNRSTKLKSSSGLKLFLREIASNPLAMGAACPSSKRLAARVAAQVPVNPTHQVIELGAGTGVITAALAKTVAAEKLVIIERAPALAQHLQKRFPKLKVICGDARELKMLLGDQSAAQVIVSSLPLRSLPSAVVTDIGKQVEMILEKNGVFIQFTYSIHRKPKAPSPQLRWVRSEYIWWNVPPARIDVFSYEK